MAIVGAGFGGLGAAIELERHGLRTSRCSSARRMSAAPGSPTPIRAASATSRRTSTRARSRASPTGRAATPSATRSTATSATASTTSTCGGRIHLRPRCSTRTWRGRRTGASRPPGPARRALAGRRARPAQRADDPRRAGARRLRGADDPHRRWGDGHDLRGKRRGGRRHRRDRDPARSPIKDRSSKLYVFQRTPPWVICLAATARSRAGALAATRGARRAGATRAAMWACCASRRAGHEPLARSAQGPRVVVAAR